MNVPSPASKLAGVRRPWRWNGYDCFAVESGEGPLVLLVHGIYAGSSSYEYRKLFPLLARSYRVVAIDLLGCGLSERPNIPYSAELFIAQILDAIATFGPTADVLVGSSMGGAFSIHAAARAGSQVARLVANCPTGLAGTLDRPANGTQRAVKRLFLSPFGQTLFNGLASRPSLRWFLENQAYADKHSITPEIIEDYYATTHLPGSRYVPAHFVGGALNVSVAGALPAVTAPVLITWGERATQTSPIESATAFVAAARNARLATFAHSRLLAHEEEPEAYAARIDAFVRETS